MIRRKYLLLFVMSFALLLVGCDNDLGYQSPDDEWTAETLVSEADVERSGVDAWFRSETISDRIFNRMWLKSWKEDCPLKRSELRYLKMLHRNADGNPQRGEMVVNAAIADKVIDVFRRLYQADYRIERMVLIDNYDADDESSMRANNSSSFNFRFMTGSTTKISKHGLGLAIDINTLYNPYVKQKDDESWHIEPATGEPYAFDRENRTDIPYKIDHNDLAYRLFTEAGFEWGGDWTSLKDYQHFEIKDTDDCFSEHEINLIRSHDTTSLMRILTVDNINDSILLRTVSSDVSKEMMATKEYELLVNRMLATVRNPENEGVGIAAPQVGILRRIVAVQRFDKEGYPFEILVNPEIISYSEQTQLGAEGCLSIPDKEGEVLRAADIIVKYIDGKTSESREEKISGFTAVIFQHEIDHLYGRLYIDYLSPGSQE